MVSGAVLGERGGFGGRGGGGRGGAAGGGAITWAADGKGFDYSWNAKKFHFELATKKATELPGDTTAAAARHRLPVVVAGAAAAGAAGQPRFPRVPAARAPSNEAVRPRLSASPDGNFHAMYRDRNLFMGDARVRQPHPDHVGRQREGPHQVRLRSWVYGEELGQTTAMWWNTGRHQAGLLPLRRVRRSPTSHHAGSRPRLQTKLDVEAYPKPGVPNPVADLFVYDLATKLSTRIDVRDGKPFTNDVVGHYVYHVRWSPDGKELLINRTNRRQNILEFVGLQPGDGALPRHHPGGVADRLGRQPPAHAVSRRQHPLHLGIGAQRIQQLLPLRSQRQADQSDHPEPVRGRQHRPAWTRRPRRSGTWGVTATTT